MTSKGELKRLAIIRHQARPSLDCLACEGSGLYDVPLENGEVRTVLCRMTDGCRKHAERVMGWAAQEGVTALVEFVRAPPNPQTPSGTFPETF
jgi:hypothetical protein